MHYEKEIYLLATDVTFLDSIVLGNGKIVAAWQLVVIGHSVMNRTRVDSDNNNNNNNND